ncbi:MAG: TIGR03086 family metal-binding protein [Candidatus Dormibacteria bacterium]
MGDAIDNLELLQGSADQMSRVIGGVRADQAGLPTPCTDWDVRRLVQHVAGQDLRNFIAVARGESADWQAPSPELRDDWRAQFDAGAAELLEVWRAVAPERTVTMPDGRNAPLRARADQQIAELCVHAWDLARATGQPTDFDDAAAEHALSWSRRTLRVDFRGPDRAFGFEVPVPDDAPAYDRLAGWFGRDPRWPG